MTTASRTRGSTGQNRQQSPREDLFKTPVNVPPHVAAFRAEMSAWARWLPKKLVNPFIGAVMVADAEGEWAVTTYEAMSAATAKAGIQKRYKCEYASPRQVERNLIEARKLGYVEYESFVTSDGDGSLKKRLRVRFTIENRLKLRDYFETERLDKEIREAEKAARRKMYKADWELANRSSKGDTPSDQASRHESGGTGGGLSRGLNRGTSGGSILRSQSFLTNPSVADPDVTTSHGGDSSPSGENREELSGGYSSGITSAWAEEETSSVPHRTSVPLLVPVESPGSQVPRTKEVPRAEASSVPLDAPAPGNQETAFTGDDEIAQDNREYVAELLGVELEAIGPSLWPWMESLGFTYESEWIIKKAADYAKAKGVRPVAYFRNILPQYLEEYRAA